MIPSNKLPTEIEIFYFYQQAINNLEKGKLDDAKTQLKSLLYSNFIKNQDYKTVHYATLISLAEIYGRSNSIHEKCEALKYYYESNLIIQDSWETNRKMAILFREIGLISKALHLTKNALESCNQVQGKHILYYQICCLSFLINELENFDLYLQMIPNQKKFKQQLLELDSYIKKQTQTQFVNELLEERSLISKKIATIPKQYLSLDYFYQEYQYEIYILDLHKFFKKIRRLLLTNLQIDDNTFEVQQKDISILPKTFFIIKSKNEKSINKNKLQEQLQKNIKQDLKKKLLLNQFEQANMKKFSLQSILQKQNFQSIEIFRKCGLDIEQISIFGKNTILQNQLTQGIQQQQLKQISNNNVLGQYLINRLKSQQFSIFNLFNKLTELIFQIPEELNLDQEAVDQVQKDLVKCYIWAQYFMDEFTNDPKIEIKILIQMFNIFKLKIKNQKTQTKEQIIILKNYQRLILKYNDKLLFQISFKKDYKEEQISQTKEFRIIITQIHNEIGILKKVFPLTDNQNQLNNTPKLSITMESSLNEILENWESPYYFIQKKDQVSSHLSKIHTYVKEENKQIATLETYQKIINVCIKQLYFSKIKDQCKQVFMMIKPIFETLYRSIQINQILALCFLKLSFIYGALDEEASQPLVLFLTFYYKNLEFPYKELFLITILQQRQIQLCKFFEIFNLNIVIKDLINLRIKMKQEFQKTYENFLEYFQEHEDVQYYLMNQINEKPGIYGHCFVKINQTPIEAKPENPGKDLQVLENFSSESEDDYYYPYPYYNNFKEIKLMNDQLTESFKIGQNQYQFKYEKQKYLLNHKLTVNLGDSQISNQIKRISKEIMKQKYQQSTKQLKKKFIVYFFENYYFNQIHIEYLLSEDEIKFIGYFLPISYNFFLDKKIVNTFTNNIVLKNIPKKIDSRIQQYADALYEQFFSKQPQKQMPKLNEMKDFLVSQKLQNEYLANIYYLLQVTREDEKNCMNILLAIAFNEIPYFWNYLYMKIFRLAYNQLNQKIQTQENDWFICQKKIQVHLQKQLSLIHLFEYRFIMDLLKAQQRQNEYEIQPNEKNYQKVQQAYQFILQQNQFIIPCDICQLYHNFRAILLIEKKIMRKLRNVSIERINQSISSYSQITKLILQMKEQKMIYFYNSLDGEVESFSDLQINVYKYLRRFIQSNSAEGVKQILKTIEDKIPFLMEVIKDNQNFQYCLSPEKRNYKIPLQEKQDEDQNQYLISNYYQQKINVVMVNLTVFFEKIKQRINCSAPQRYVIEAIYYLCHIQLQNKNLSKNQLDNLYETISIIYSSDIKDLVKYQKQYGIQYSEQDEVLREYYHHDLIFLYQKQKIIKLFIRINIANKKWNELLDLIVQMPKNFDLRGYQICLALIENQKQFDDPQLLLDVLCHIDYFLKRNQQYTFLNENKEYKDMFIKLYNQKQRDTQSDKEKELYAKKFIENQSKEIKKTKRDNPQCQDLQNIIEIG
ncbi:unnamed protein product [Paramecium sonneborni]|uniref:Uncharacterized protein n=1 Tax=Paramecium sonneborni TaxID=65129 RepID=A0A8S1M0Y8_9CILI|nr:unnamed protein product [Paramecium sonneborni]